MKQLLLFAIPLLLLIGCNSEPEVTTEKEKAKTTTSKTIQDTSETEVHVPEPPTERPYRFEEFNKDWIMLNEEENEFQITDSWDSQEQGIHFTTDTNGTNWVVAYLAQDSDDSEVKDFEATLTEGDGIWTVTGSFNVLFPTVKYEREEEY